MKSHTSDRNQNERKIRTTNATRNLSQTLRQEKFPNKLTERVLGLGLWAFNQQCDMSL
jgi:hypothetical protein